MVDGQYCDREMSCVISPFSTTPLLLYMCRVLSMSWQFTLHLGVMHILFNYYMGKVLNNCHCHIVHFDLTVLLIRKMRNGIIFSCYIFHLSVNKKNYIHFLFPCTTQLFDMFDVEYK